GIMVDESAGNNIQRIAKIFRVVLDRPEDDYSRTEGTRSVYNGIRKICLPPEPVDVEVGSTVSKRLPLHEAAAEIACEWERLFKASTEEFKSVAKAL
ncbi:MAG: hypothetical protein ACRC0M_03075, partial [Legionella sp.]